MSNVTKLMDEGISLLKRGRTTKARVSFEQARQLEPDNAMALSYMGVLMALADKNFKDGEDYCFRAVLKNMQSAQLHANLAWVYHLQGKRKSAVESIDAALQRDANNADALRIRGLMGSRQSPPISFLSRNHPINKGIGQMIHKLKKK